MDSLTAGSPSCNCKNPDTCIHSFTLKVKDRSFSYKQKDFVKYVDIIDEQGKGKPLSLSLVDKTCVTQNQQCPQGVIYNVNESKSLKNFHKGNTSYTVRFDDKQVAAFDTFDSIDFIVDYIMAKDAKSALPKSIYFLQVGQCRGEPFTAKSLTFNDGVSKVSQSAPNSALSAYINVYPEFKWEISVTIGAGQEASRYTDSELKKQQTEQNKNAGLPQRGRRGWTKRPPYQINSSLEIGGTLKTKMGKVTHEYASTLEAEFKKKSHKLSLLNKSLIAVDTVTQALSTTEGRDASIKLLKTDILFPEIEIKGSGELKEDANTSSLYIERQVSLGLAPLIGMRITLDLIQAFAAWYRADFLLAAVREKLMAQEDAYKEGKNAAFVGMKFELAAEGSVGFTLAFKSDAKNNWEWQKVDTAEVKLKLVIEANVRAGIRFYIANGALEVGGKAVAEGCIGLDSPTKDKLDLVFYHNGVIALVYVKFSASIASTSPSDTSNDSDDVMGGSSGSGKGNVEKGNEKEWIIHDKLEKSKSKFRFNLL